MWVAVIVSGLLVVSVVAVSILGFAMMGDPGFDSEYFVEDSAVVDAVDAPCTAMVDSAKDIAIFSTPAAGAAKLSAFVDSGRRIVDAIDAARSSDDESRKWRHDWQLLLDSLERYAGRLRKGPDATFDEPTTKAGFSIIDRMAMGSPENCELPFIIGVFDRTPPPVQY